MTLKKGATTKALYERLERTHLKTIDNLCQVSATVNGIINVEGSVDHDNASLEQQVTQ